MEYYLYIDESGTATNPIDDNNQLKYRTPRVFCLGGIIVNEKEKQYFESEHKRLLNDYFKDLKLASNFKLHYNELRMMNYPYSSIGPKRSQQLVDEFFEIIKKSDAKLLSCTIDLIGHYKKYTTPVNPLVLGLIRLVERFFDYTKEKNVKNTSIIYERFNKAIRECVYRDYKTHEQTNFKTRLNFKEIIHDIHDGDPTKEPVLQFTDFWTYLPFIKEKTFLDVQDFVKQYYNFTSQGNGGNFTIRY